MARYRTIKGVKSCTLLNQYIPYTHSNSPPLEITGLDSVLVPDYVSKNLMAKSDSTIRPLDLPVAKLKITMAEYYQLLILENRSCFNVK